MLSEDDKLIADYLKTNEVNVIEKGYRKYDGNTPSTKQARLVTERHERTRQVYRDLIKSGTTKKEIAITLNVSEAQVRKMSNRLCLINELRR